MTVSFVSVGAQRWAAPGRAGPGLAACDTKHSSRDVTAFASPRGCLSWQYSVFVTEPQSLRVAHVGLEVFTSPCGCATLQGYHGIPTTQANSAGDTAGSLDPALTYPDLKLDLKGERSLCRTGCQKWKGSKLGSCETGSWGAGSSKVNEALPSLSCAGWAAHGTEKRA